MKLQIVIIIFLCIVMQAAKAYSLPQFPIRFGDGIFGEHNHHNEVEGMTMDCRTCHINPTGGGMRNDHGWQFLLENLPKNRFDEEDEGTLKEARLNRIIAIGTDLRFAYLLSQSESTSAYKNSFFPMQADLYAAFMPHRNFTIYYQDGIQGNKEFFGLVHTLPANAHIKFGKFLPPYGLKLDDHTSFIRDKLGFGNNFGQDSEAGLEAGFAKGQWFGNAAIFNGTRGAPDDNTAKAISCTGGVKTPLFWLAGSFYSNKTAGSAGKKDNYIGVYTAIHFRQLSMLGEWDWISKEMSGSSKTNGNVAYAEISADLIKGVAAKVKYDFYNPDQITSQDIIQRITLGVDLYPYPFSEVLIQYRKNIEESNVTQNDQFLIMAHLFY
ncbi:MAG: hypothetical protein HZA08_06105 [Nitrospirae bacterium]|nr:hypothetical protein [Nitrospirota bacterium]